MYDSIKRGVDPYADADTVKAILNVVNRVYLPFSIPQTELLAGTSIELVAPVKGVIARARATVQTAVTTGGDITFEVNTVAVAGLTLTVPDAAAAGARYTDTPTADTDEPTGLSATANVEAGDRIEVIPDAAFATAGAITGVLEIIPTEMM